MARRPNGDRVESRASGTKRPRHGKHSKKRRRSIWAYILIIAAVVLLVLPVATFTVAYSLTDVPEPEQLVTKQIATIVESDGTTEIARIVPPEGNREVVTSDKIPDSLKAAVISAEDREFWKNPGFSVKGFARAVIGQITGNHAAGGGSTITQQYVKNAVVGNERSIKRKLKELVVAAKMANEWTKDEVLTAYLNTIYFGRSSYGVAAAAQAYFGIPVDQLTPAQSAVLAAAIQRPSQLDPWTNRADAEARWNYVLDGMVTTGFFTPQQRAEQKYPQVTDPALNKPFTVAEGTNGLIKRQVMAELAAHGITEEDVHTKGLTIVTTINPVVQNAVMDAVNNHRPTWDDQIRQAVVSVNPATGAVEGYFGGDDPHGWDYANNPRPTGSTFKIFGLAAALQQGIGLNQLYSSAPITEGAVTISNSGGDTCGTCTIAQALKHSFNTSFIRLEHDLVNGSQDVADMAHALGVARSLPSIPHTLTEDGATPFDGVILGQYDTRPIDMATALATITDSGVWHPTHFVESVTDASGQVVYRFNPDQGQRRVSANVANNVLKAMGPVAQWSLKALAGGRPSASKTGTVQLGDTGQNKDGWMIGSTPQLVTVAWVGTDKNTPLKNSWGAPMYGAELPGTLWKATMDAALKGQDFEEFPEAKPLGYNSPKVVVNVPVYRPKYQAPSRTGQAQVPSSTASEAPASAPAAEPGAGAGHVPVSVPPVPVPAAPQSVEILPGVTVQNPFVPQQPAAPAPAEPARPAQPAPAAPAPAAPAPAAPAPAAPAPAAPAPAAPAPAAPAAPAPAPAG